jgi:hypothetical protein
MKLSVSKLRGLPAVMGGSLWLLSACGGGGDGGESDLLELPTLAVSGLGGTAAIDVLNPWLVSLRTFRLDSITPGTGDARVATLQYSASRNVQDHIDFYTTRFEIDTCEVFTENDTGGGGGGGGGDIPYVAGGESVVFNAPNGTWFTMNQTDVGIYDVDNELPDAFPAGTTLSIPGDVFPSVGAIPVVEPPVPIRFLPEAGAVSADSVYEWQASGGPGEVMIVDLLEFDAAGVFIDFRISCYMEDDGAFQMPADIVQAIADNPNTLEVRYTRQRRSLSVVDGVVAFVRTSVAE